LLNNNYFISLFVLDCCSFTSSQFDTKMFFCKRLLTENPRNAAKYVLPMLEGKPRTNAILKSSLSTFRQNQLFFLEACHPKDIAFFKLIKENGKLGRGLLESFYNVAKTTVPNISFHSKDQPYLKITQKLSVNGLVIERPWKFCQLVCREGGINSLLLLLARVVELGLDDSSIAYALDIIFLTMFSSPNIYHDANHQETILLLTRILRSEICKASLHTVAVFFKHALTEPIIVFDEKRSIFQFCYESNAIVCASQLFEAVFDCWKIWSKNPSAIDHEKSTSCMEAVLKLCTILLRDEHPFRQLNVETFRRMGFVKKVSYVFKSDTENVETSNPSVVYQIVDILSAIVGSPPDLTIVRDLISMALLLHESNQTFVAHSKSNFYYLLSTPDHDITVPLSSDTTWHKSRSFAGTFIL